MSNECYDRVYYMLAYVFNSINIIYGISRR